VELPCTYLIVCTGSSYAPPIKAATQADASTLAELRLSGRLASLRAAALRCKEASSVLIVGGGTVGVELAAEVGPPIQLIIRQFNHLDEA
jgi:NADH dehydrogenase FAD-containing subunit